MNRAKLTKSFIDKAEYKGEDSGAYIVWDTVLSEGFGLRIYPSGKKSFVIKYRVNSRQRNLVLGSYGKLTLDQARKMARKKFGEIIDGGDPLGDKEKANKEITVEDFCDIYMKGHAKKLKKEKSWKEDERRINAHIKPAWGKRKLNSITTSDANSLHLKVSKRGKYEANRLHSLISKMFNLARDWTYLEKTFYNPANDVQKFTEESRDTSFSPRQLVKLVSEMEKLQKESIFAWVALWLLFITGCRKNEILGAKWEFLDKENLELTIPETKNGKKHIVTLNDFAFYFIDQLPKGESPFLFPGKRDPQINHLVNIDKRWQKVKKAAGMKDYHIHDIRHNFGTSLLELNTHPRVMQKAMNHSSIKQAMKYASASKTMVRKAVDNHSKILEQIRNEILNTPPTKSSDINED